MVHNLSASRKEIAQKIGVIKATLTKVVSVLIEDGIVKELCQIEEGKVGRKQILIDIEGGFCYAAGFDITNTYIKVIMLNSKTNIVENKQWVFYQLTQTFLDEAIEYMLELFLKYSSDSILVIGLLLQGHIENDICHSLPIKDIKTQVESHCDTKVIMMNNAKGIAVTEAYFGNTSQNFLLVKYGPGIAGVIIIDGEIVMGAKNRAGEFGHILWNDKSENKCAMCGKTGCLEFILHFGQIIKKSDNSKENVGLDFQTVLEASKKDDSKALWFAIENLAQAINLTADIIDPKEIFLAGDIFNNEECCSLLIEKLNANKSEKEKKRKLQLIKNYREKRIKASGVVVLNEFFRQ